MVQQRYFLYATSITHQRDRTLIDYFFLFATATAAETDPVVGAFYNVPNTIWRPDVCFPGLKVVTPQTVINGISSLTGFWLLIAQATPNVALAANANLVMVLDRDAANANGAFVLAASITGTNRSNLTFSPTPFGANYPQPLGQ